MGNEQALLTIGALSKATGVPADTLRTWERRYGFPVALRTQSGHRRYPMRTLEQLHLVTAALALGHRPCAVLSASSEQLQELLADGEDDAAEEPSAARTGEIAQAAAVNLEQWFERLESFDGRDFERVLRTTYSALGTLPFLERAVAPFLRELGIRWASGELGVRHEHFASERLREFLVAQWRPLSDSANGPAYILACPAGEYHVLGLHLVAATVALTGGRVVLLGSNTPAAEIANAAINQSAAAVLLSVAAGIDQARLRVELSDLQARLPPHVALVVGGGGFEGQPEVTSFRSLSDLERWLNQRGAAPGRS